MRQKAMNAPRLQQRQKLALHVGAVQSLEILRLPLQELGEMVMEKIYENPLLEMEPPPGHQPDAFAQLSADLQVEAPAPEERPDDAPVDVNYREIWRRMAAGSAAEAAQGEAVSFGDMLREQIGAMPLDAPVEALCLYLVDCLDRRGYLAEAPEDIAEALACPLEDVMQALYLLQSLHPAGVGARNLQECLVLQLVAGDGFNAHTIALVKNGLSLLAAGDLGGMARLLKTDRQTAAEAARIVRGLNPIPSQGYYTGEATASVVPDAVVRAEGEGFSITMNERTVPRLELSREYSHMLKTAQNEADRSYLQNRMNDAKQLIKAINDRERTIVRLLRYVVDEQPGYFRGSGELAPMTMAAAAEALDVHISTISRAVSGKYIVCAAGTVPLRALFSAGLPAAGEQNLTAVAIRGQLKKCIEGEAPDAPLSDEDLRTALQSFGIEISRRTVAKYRAELGYPIASKRRRLRALAEE